MLKSETLLIMMMMMMIDFLNEVVPMQDTPQEELYNTRQTCIKLIKFISMNGKSKGKNKIMY